MSSEIPTIEIGDIVWWFASGRADDGVPPCLAFVTGRNVAYGSLELSVVEPMRSGFIGKSGVKHILSPRGRKEDPSTSEGAWDLHTWDRECRDQRDRVDRLEKQVAELLAAVGDVPVTG